MMCGGSMTRDDIEDIHYLVNAALCRKAAMRLVSEDVKRTRLKSRVWTA